MATTLLARDAAQSLPEPTLRFSALETPVGTLFVAYRGLTVRCTDLATTGRDFAERCQQLFGAAPLPDNAPPERLRSAILRALDGQNGDARFRGAYDLSPLTAFQQRVLEKTGEIRRGEVRSYQWVARAIGAPQAVRAVGTALAVNPIPILIPCHRVVKADYRLGNYGCGGIAQKRALLQWEGVDVDLLDELARTGRRLQGSRTTRIYCLPGCSTGRRMKPENRVLFVSAADAQLAGYRPCKVCRPE